MAALEAPAPDVRNAKRLVVKIGSALLVGPQGLRRDWLLGLAADVADARARHANRAGVVGLYRAGTAGAAGPRGAPDTEQSQAAASVGQIQLRPRL